MNNTQLDQILSKVAEQPNYMNMAKDSQGNQFIEYSKDFGNSIGITVCGSYLENGMFEMDYYYPYFRGSKITIEEQIEVEKHADKDLKRKTAWKNKFLPKEYVTLSGLSLGGKIILPINKSETQVLKKDQITQERNHLIAAARDGDEDAIESLTLEDIDMYTILSRRVMNEDILSIVDSYFMPYGVESDQYSVLGEILNVCHIENRLTHQKICVLTIDTNDLIYDICINEEDLLGEPVVGRRFKGNIWMQGCINLNN